MQRKIILPLTSLRFFAAAAIVVHHCKVFFGGKTPIPAPLDHAVTFFFVLSGFVLTYATFDLGSIEKKKRFLVNRLARLAPTHFLCNVMFIVFIGWLLSLRKYDVFSVTSVLNFSLLHSLVPLRSVNFSLNGLSWAISAEVVFYIAFIFLIGVVRSKPWHVFVGAVLVGSVTIWTSGQFAAMESTTLSSQLVWSLTYINPLTRGMEFVFGMLVGVSWEHLRKYELNYLTGTLLEVAALGIVVAVSLNYWVISGFLKSLQFFSPAFFSWFHRAGSFPMYGLLIIVFSYQAGAVSKLLSFKWLLLLGECSYCIFMYHVMLRILFEGFVTESNAIWLFAVYFLSVIVFSVFMFKFFENPVRKYIISKVYN